MHVAFSLPIMAVLLTLTVLGMLMAGWCWLCFRVSCWIFRGIFGRSQRVRPVRVVAPEPAVVHAAAYQPPPAYQQLMRDHAMKRSGICSSRRRHSGGAGVVMTVLAVCLAVFAFKNVAHHRSVSRSVAHTVKPHKHGGKRVVVAAERVPPVDDIQFAADELKESDVFARKDGAWEIDGYGRTRDDATEQALEKASAEVTAYLHARYPTLQWPISPEFIQEKLRTNLAIKDRIDVGGGIGSMDHVRLSVEITPENQKYILQKDREYRKEHRTLWLAQVLAAVVVVLATIAAYIRLDEASKGYYSGWLRLAGTAAVAAAGLSLWYFA